MSICYKLLSCSNFWSKLNWAHIIGHTNKKGSLRSMTKQVFLFTKNLDEYTYYLTKPIFLHFVNCHYSFWWFFWHQLELVNVRCIMNRPYHTNINLPIYWTTYSLCHSKWKYKIAANSGRTVQLHKRDLAILDFHSMIFILVRHTQLLNNEWTSKFYFSQTNVSIQVLLEREKF